MKMKWFSILVLVSLLVSPSLAYNMFLSAPGLKGGVSDRDHREAVGLVAIKGPTKPGESGPLIVAKNLDGASNALFAACLAGTAYQSLVIDVTQNVGGTPFIVSKMTLGKAVVRGIEFKYESSLVEEVTLGYETISWEYIDLAPDGSKRGSTIQNWNNQARTTF